MMKKPLRILFMGTPEFAVSSLEGLIEAGYQVVAVVTAPDTPSGRGLKLQPSPVKISALGHGIPVLQPEKLKDETFLDELGSFEASLQVVVAFRMLPEVVWAMPSSGTFNLHASLLPQYRGAAPIQRALMNGETETGVTTFYLKHEIDTGHILLQEKVPIGPEETAGELHDRLKEIGARLVVKTVKAIEEDAVKPLPQEMRITGAPELKTAPKIFKDDCRLDFSKEVTVVFNKVRGLSPSPGAFTFLQRPDGEKALVKVFRAVTQPASHSVPPGAIQSDGKTFMKVSCSNGWLDILEIQQAGKRRMGIREFLTGNSVNASYLAVSDL